MANKVKAATTTAPTAQTANGIMPKGWRTVRFGEVVRDVNESERNPIDAGLERFVGLEHIEPENLHLKQWGLLADGEISFTKRFRKGQVLFGKRRAYQKKVAVTEFDGICSSDILTFEPKGDDLLPELLPFIVQSEGFFEHALGTSSGSLSPRTRWNQLQDYEFPLPPKDEQLRIANILWAADEALQHYTEVIKDLLLLRASMFHETIGMVAPLTIRDVLARRRDSTDNQTPIARIDSLASNDRQTVQVGPFGGSLASKHFSQSGTMVLKINNITDEGELSLHDVVNVPDDYADSLSRYRVSEGDLITAAQATTGRSALVTREAEGSLISQHLIRVVVDHQRCEPRYLLSCFHSPLIIQQIDAVKSKTTRDGLNTEDVLNFVIPLPDIGKQKQIVVALESIDNQRAAILSHWYKLKSVQVRYREHLFSKLRVANDIS